MSAAAEPGGAHAHNGGALPGELADAVATTVTALPSVVRLYGGGVAPAATYLRGRRVVGVRMVEDRVEVHVVARWGVPVRQVAAEVRAALVPVVRGAAVDVVVGDVMTPEEIAADPAGALGLPPAARAPQQPTP